MWALISERWSISERSSWRSWRGLRTRKRSSAASAAWASCWSLSWPSDMESWFWGGGRHALARGLKEVSAGVGNYEV